MKNHIATKSTPIDGVILKPLTTFADDRGWFRELWRSDDHGGPRSVAQTSITTTHPGVVKAFHGHALQDDVWYVSSGSARVVLVDRRKTSPTFGNIQTIVCGQDAPLLITIPRGVYHGYQVLGTLPVVLVYHVTKTYNRQKPDELRIAWDDELIGYDWSIQNR